ncbi:MAG: gliding motility-associated C-terminal domain-containing protein [Crocinitomicaceae bacterium]|nr:gliding motility-associated C-terminal domain-containing protein [Crocinitomicaceae bacterium]
MEIFSQNKSDCVGGIVLCNDIYTETQASFSTGNFYEYTGACNANLEVSSVWYKFTVQQSGNLSFILTPNTPSADYDWGLFNISNGGCQGIGNGTSPQVSCNSWGVPGINGATGISTAMGGYSNTGGPGSSYGPPFNADLAVQTGQTYALVVMNWSNSSSGYTIDFGPSTASLFDNIPPQPLSATINCAATTINLHFSEPILISSLQPTDFSLTGSSGTYTIAAAVPQTSGALQDDDVVLTISGGVTQPGSYSLIITGNSGYVQDACGNLGQGSVPVDIFPPVLQMTPSTSLCMYQSIQLQAQNSAAPGTTYSWSPALGLDNPSIVNPVATPQETTTYSVQVSNSNGCSAQGSVTITITGGQVTKFELLPSDTMICEEESVQLNVYAEEKIWADDFDPGISWGDWELIDGGTVSNICGAVWNLGLYFNGGAPRQAITNPMDLTGGGTVYFSLKIASGAAPCDNAEPGDDIILSYSVNNGAFIDIQTFNEAAYPNFTGIEVPVPIAAQEPNVRFRWMQTGTFANNQDNWVLDNMYIGRMNNNGYIYTWYPFQGLDDTTSPDPIASPVQTTTYHVSMVYQGCSFADSVLIDVGEPFTLSIPLDTILCSVQPVEIFAVPDGTDQYTYQWTPATGLNDASLQNPTATPATTTIYTANVTSSHGCTTSGSVSINVGAYPAINVTATDTSICQGEIVTLNAGLNGSSAAGISFEWSPDISIVNNLEGVTEASPQDDIVSLLTAVQTSSGCISADSVAIVVWPSFEVVATPEDTAVCIPVSVILAASSNATTALTWQWTPANLVSQPTAQNTSLITDASADVIVVGMDGNGCTASDTVHIEKIIETTELGPALAFCSDESTTLNTGWPDSYDINWSTGDTTSIITIHQSGTYSVEVTSPEGCFSSDAVVVNVYTRPVVDLGADQEICAGEKALLTAGPAGWTYHWNTNQTQASISVGVSGNYVATAYNNICSASDNITVTVHPLPQNDFADETSFCFMLPPYYYELDAGNPGSSYLWSNGSTEQAITLSEESFVSVSVTTAYGCTDAFNIWVKEVCPGALYVPNSFTPNGDGINDVWVVKGKDLIEYHIDIYNRWGEKIFESNDVNEAWVGERKDGVYFVDSGVYNYIIRFKVAGEKGPLSETMIYKGHINLVR